MIIEFYRNIENKVNQYIEEIDVSDSLVLSYIEIIKNNGFLLGSVLGQKLNYKSHHGSDRGICIILEDE